MVFPTDRRRKLATTALVLVAACDGPTGQPPKLDADTSGDARDTRGYEIVATIPATPNRDLDVLFVIGDTPGMADKQANLAAAMPKFVGVLSSAIGGLPNLQVGVVTSDLGTSSSLDASPAPAVGACSGTGKHGGFVTNGAAITGPFLVATDATHNFTGDLAATLGAMVRAGEGGCEFPQHLGAMRAALDGRNAGNAGFLRASATLLVVIASDRDDCTATTGALFDPDTSTLGPLDEFRCTRLGLACTVGGTTPDQLAMPGIKQLCLSAPSAIVDYVPPYVDVLVAAKGGDATKVLLGGIYGPPAPVEVVAGPALAPSCSYAVDATTETALPGVRLTQFVEDAHSSVGSICARDLSTNMLLVAQLAVRAIGTACLDRGLADTDPAAGLQPACVVDDIAGSSTTAIPACGDPIAAPCWHVVDDPAGCPGSSHQKIVIERLAPPDPATKTVVKCAS